MTRQTHIGRLALSLGLALLALQPIAALPRNWYNPPLGFLQPVPPCTDHPSKKMLLAWPHGDPLADSAITFQLVDANGNPTASQNICPGKDLLVKVSFPEPRLALLTASSGAFATPTDSKCANRADLGLSSAVNQAASHVMGFKVPCNATGTVEFKVTSASDSNRRWRQATWTATINPSCAASSCGGARPSPRASPRSSPRPSPRPGNSTRPAPHASPRPSPSSSPSPAPVPTPVPAPGDGCQGLSFRLDISIVINKLATGKPLLDQAIGLALSVALEQLSRLPKGIDIQFVERTVSGAFTFSTPAPVRMALDTANAAADALAALDPTGSVAGLLGVVKAVPGIGADIGIGTIVARVVPVLGAVVA